MDGFTEKKWFAYLGDHHEGPFSLQEIQAKMQHGQLSATNFVWAEGMADWKVMTEIDAFEPLFKSPKSSEAPETSPVPPAQIFNSGPQLSPAPVLSAMGAEPIHDSGPSLASFGSMSGGASEEIAPEAIELPEDVLKNPAHKKALVGQILKFGLLFLALGAVGFIYSEGYLGPLVKLGEPVVSALQQALAPVGDKIPFLSNLLSPLPKLEDVDPADYEQLKSAAQAKLDSAGPVIALALSKTELLSPVFYVASNLPDGAILDVYVEGVPETLLNQLSATAKTQVVIMKKFGKSSQLRIDGGDKNLPRGQYNVYVVDPETQPAPVRPLLGRMSQVRLDAPPVSVPKGLRVVLTRSFFLGGFRDATYTARLKEYHDRISEKAKTELGEVKQFSATIASQLDSTLQKFTALRKGRKPTAKQRLSWEAFNAQWSKLGQQLDQSFSKLTPDSLKNDYFYGALYEQSAQTETVIERLHDLQNEYFSGKSDPQSFDIQLGEQVSIARSAVESLKTKTDQVEKLPPSPSGLPKRDGI